MRTRLIALSVLLCVPVVCIVGAMDTVGTQKPSLYWPSLAAPVGTPQFNYEPLRTVTASDTALNNTTKAWATIKTKFKKIPKDWNGVRISCYADGDSTGEGDPNGGTFSYKVFVCEQFASAKLAATGTWAIGELALSHDPTNDAETELTYGITDPNSSKWGELPVLTTDDWDGVAVNGASNDVGEIRFDARGAYGVYVEVTSLANCTHLYIIIKGY